MEMNHVMNNDYMAHGFCFSWEKPLVILHVASDIVTGISYYSIPIAMFYFAYKRRDLPFFNIFLMFAIFILSCGTTHLFAAYTIFVPDYWPEGFVKAFTATVSAVTAIYFIPRIPEAIAFPSIVSTLAEVKKLNSELNVKNAALQLANVSIEKVLDPVFWIDEDARIMRVNEAACASLGYTKEEMLGFSVTDIDPRFNIDVWQEHWKELKERGALRFETEHRTKSGHVLDVEVSTNYISFEGQEFNCAIIRDITERKRTEDYLRNNERRLARQFNISQYPFTNEQEFLDHALSEVIELTGSRVGYIYLYDERKQQFTLNSWSNEVMVECAVVEQQTVYDLDKTGIWGEAVRQRKPIMVNNFAAGNPLKKGYPEGHVHLGRFLTVPVMVEEVIVAVVGVANKQADYNDVDIMHLKLFMEAVWKIVTRKRSYEERLKLEQQLLHAQKLESLGVLAGGIAHDFNNILTAIIGNADLALMRLNPESPAVDNLQNISQSAFRAADLAKQMLAYSGKGRFVIESLDLNILLEEMLHMLEVSISKKAVLRLNPHMPLPAVEADATQMRQIVMNLVINASEAIGDRSGVIALTTGCMECDRSYLKDVWLNENLTDGLYVYLEITDTGCGMDKDTLAKLFDPFFTTKFTGRGLGMSAVLGIVRGHKGAIRVYSELGKGTAFKILLPASCKPTERLHKDIPSDNWHGSGTALLIDDEETIRNIGTALLNELGFTTITAVDGREAVDIFKSTPGIAFVILDLTMPHMDGEECFRELRKLNPAVKVIMSSGYNEQEVTQKFVGKGLAGFIQKPYKLSVLKEAIMGLKITG